MSRFLKIDLSSSYAWRYASHNIQIIGRDPATGPRPNWSGQITGGTKMMDEASINELLATRVGTAKTDDSMEL